MLQIELFILSQIVIRYLLDKIIMVGFSFKIVNERGKII